MTPAVALEDIAAEAEGLRVLHERVTALDPGAHLRPEHAERLMATVVTPLREALAETLRRIGRLQDVCDDEGAETGEWGEHLEPTGLHDGPRMAATLADELWQAVGNLAFAASSELRRADRELASATSSHDQRVVASESARRKIRRAIRALLAAIGQALGHAFELSGLDAEVEVAVAVRRMYAKFRRSLPPCDLADPALIRRALRYAAVSLAVMVGSGDFSEIRARDRQMLLELQARILSWAREGGSEMVGRQLYQDLQTAADLLRTINQRQELIAHDRAAFDRIARALARADAPAALLASVLPDLHALDGRDDELDDVIGAIREGANDGATIARLRRVLAACAAPGAAFDAA